MNRYLFIPKYLERIKLYDKILPNVGTLWKIHRQHLLNIPFENLDIIDNKRIDFNIENVWNKIIEQNRGGICYELNGLLFHLLKYIGFDVKYISAKVLEDGNEFDHLLLIVHIEKDSWLVDVGFGDNFLEPLKLQVNIVQKDLKGCFKVVKTEDEMYQLLKSLDGSEYSLEYTFTLQARNLEDFKERCLYFETSSESRFIKNRICSLEKENGRISLKDDKLIITEYGIKKEKEIKSENEYLRYLKQFFHIVLAEY